MKRATDEARWTGGGALALRAPVLLKSFSGWPTVLGDRIVADFRDLTLDEPVRNPALLRGVVPTLLQ